MGYDTYFSGSFAIAPPISEQLADEMEADYEPWQFTPDAIEEPGDGLRDSEAAEIHLAEAVEKLIALGHTLHGEMGWTWDGDSYEFGEFVMIENRLHHRTGFMDYAAPLPYRADTKGSTP